MNKSCVIKNFCIFGQLNTLPQFRSRNGNSIHSLGPHAYSSRTVDGSSKLLGLHLNERFTIFLFVYVKTGTYKIMRSLYGGRISMKLQF